MLKASQWNPPKAGRGHLQDSRARRKKIVKLTNQKFSPNTGAANWSKRLPQAGAGQVALRVRRLQHGAVPAAGRPHRVHVSNRDGFRPAKGYPAICLQLFVMDDRDTDSATTRPDEPGEDRPPEPRRGAAPGRARATAASCTARSNRRARAATSCGASGRSTRTAPTGTRWSAPSTRRRAERLPLPDAADATARSWSSSTTTRTTAASARTSSCRDRACAFASYPDPDVGPAAQRVAASTPAFGPANMNDSANQAVALRPARQRQPALVPDAVHAARQRVADAVQHGLRRPGRPLDSRRQELARGRQVHAPVGRTGQSPADVLLARPGESSVHLPAADRRRHLPHQERRSDRERAGADAAHQERPELQRVLAARGRAVQPHLRHQGADAIARASRTTASSRSICRKGRRSRSSARRASTSARATPTAACPKARSPRPSSARTTRGRGSTRSRATATACR